MPAAGETSISETNGPWKSQVVPAIATKNKKGARKRLFSGSMPGIEGRTTLKVARAIPYYTKGKNEDFLKFQLTISLRESRG